jgi:periplasmic copper chaperone A
MRLPRSAVASGTLAVALGAAGLIRAAVPVPVASGSPAPAAAPIVVTGAYVRAPVPPTRIAAAYFTVYNTTGSADRLGAVTTGAGATALIHTVASDGSMTAAPNGVRIPAHGKLVLATGGAHVMIEHLFGTLAAGQTVNIELDFDNAGTVDVTAPVIAVGAPVPPGGHS